MTIEYNTRGILQAFFRRKWQFLLVFILFAAAGAVWLAGVVPVYQARGSMLVRFGQNARPEIVMPGSARPAEYSYSDRSEIMESNAKILQSHDLLRAAVADMGIGALYPDMATDAIDAPVAAERAVNRLLGGDLDVRTAGGSNIIELYVRNGDPKIAAGFAEKLMDMFIRRQAEMYNTAQTGFLDEQTTAMKDRLESSRGEFLDFKKEMGIAAIDEELDQLLREKSDLSSLAFQSLAEAQKTLAALEAKESELKSTYKNDSPVLARVHQSVVLAKKQLAERQGDMNGAEEGEGTLAPRLATIEERIAWLETQRGRYNELEQRVKMDEENYRYYQQRGEEARVNNLLNAENITRISVVDRPAVPLSPVYPRKKMMLLAFVMAGILCGLGLALALELLDDRLTSPGQAAAALDLPVLATFGKVKGV